MSAEKCTKGQLRNTIEIVRQFKKLPYPEPSDTALDLQMSMTQKKIDIEEIEKRELIIKDFQDAIIRAFETNKNILQIDDMDRYSPLNNLKYAIITIASQASDDFQYDYKGCRRKDDLYFDSTKIIAGNRDFNLSKEYAQDMILEIYPTYDSEKEPEVVKLFEKEKFFYLDFIGPKTYRINRKKALNNPFKSKEMNSRTFSVSVLIVSLWTQYQVNYNDKHIYSWFLCFLLAQIKVLQPDKNERRKIVEFIRAGYEGYVSDYFYNLYFYKKDFFADTHKKNQERLDYYINKYFSDVL